MFAFFSSDSKLDSNTSEILILHQALQELTHPLNYSGLLQIDPSVPVLKTNHFDRPGPRNKSDNAIAGVIREVTAYNVGDPKQNYGNPCISANGENICAALAKGLRRCAANFVPFGTKLHIEGFGFCTVTDRMNKRYKNRVDIAMKLTEKARALKFGLRKLKVQIVKSN